MENREDVKKFLEVMIVAVQQFEAYDRDTNGMGIDVSVNDAIKTIVKANAKAVLQLARLDLTKRRIHYLTEVLGNMRDPMILQDVITYLENEAEKESSKSL